MSMKKIILGTVQLGIPYGINNQLGQPNSEVAHEILSFAQKNGVEILDTADVYGESYTIINRFHQNHPPFKLMTKFKLDDSASTIMDAFKRTRRGLQFEKLYNYSFHSFIDLQNFSDLSGLSKLKASGAVESIGISVYDNDEFQRCLDFDFIDIIQIPFNLLDNYRLRGELMSLAKKKGKIIHVRSIYLQGLFYKKEIIGKLSALTPYIQGVSNLAHDNKIEIGELALRYVLSIPEIDGILIGVETLDQLERNLDLCKKGPLRDSIIVQIHNLDIKETHLLNPVNWE